MIDHHLKGLKIAEEVCECHYLFSCYYMIRVTIKMEFVLRFIAWDVRHRLIRS